MDKLVLQKTQEIVMPKSAKALKWAIAGMIGLAASALAEMAFDKGYLKHVARKTVK